MKPNILVIDNFDSFTYNLVQMLEESGRCRLVIKKHDEPDAAEAAGFDKILFSPGAGIPNEYPVMRILLDRFKSTKSFLGVCLGHQAVAEYFGAKLINLNSPVHGMRQCVNIQQADYLFAGIPERTHVGLYHSWAVSGHGMPDDLKITASTEDGTVMAVSHGKFDIHGVQFHPESYMSEHGRQMLQNWLNAR